MAAAAASTQEVRKSAVKQTRAHLQREAPSGEGGKANLPLNYSSTNNTDVLDGLVSLGKGLKVVRMQMEHGEAELSAGLCTSRLALHLGNSTLIPAEFLLKNNTLYIQALLPRGSVTSHLAQIALFTNLSSLS